QLRIGLKVADGICYYPGRASRKPSIYLGGLVDPVHGWISSGKACRRTDTATKLQIVEAPTIATAEAINGRSGDKGGTGRRVEPVVVFPYQIGYPIISTRQGEVKKAVVSKGQIPENAQGILLL